MTPDWQPTAEAIAQMQGECPAVDQNRALPEFRDYWIGEGKPKVDWNATYKNRIRTLHDRNGNGNKAKSTFPVVVPIDEPSASVGFSDADLWSSYGPAGRKWIATNGEPADAEDRARFTQETRISWDEHERLRRSFNGGA